MFVMLENTANTMKIMLQNNYEKNGYDRSSGKSYQVNDARSKLKTIHAGEQ